MSSVIYIIVSLLSTNNKSLKDGVRAGAKRLGRKATDKKAMRDRDLELEEAQRKGCGLTPFSSASNHC